jgi:hypothetical protein
LIGKRAIWVEDQDCNGLASPGQARSNVEENALGAAAIEGRENGQKVHPPAFAKST